MTVLHGTKVGTVWLVSDRYGGRIFDLCSTPQDAREVERFHSGETLTVQELPVYSYAIGDNSSAPEED
ncbi:hypothetical protein AS850_02820 [Frondihabitans sp. 762G35]|uniref:hypothetical protein n=1 Tax=Frondihabitans sp. 762G35 TaxID=1446794 RepID=UPI000D2297C7|nr:hypothetical protein [Frondihabitans sp. 762G35]ARC56005.1 hypothetical protein AS850_02820 [Frondihabitans sp. 762G35]